MTKPRNLVLIAVAVIAIAAVALNGSLVRGLFGPRAMLDVSGGHQTQQDVTSDPNGNGSTTPGTLPGSGVTAANAKAVTSVSIAPDSRGDRGYIIDARLASKDGKPIANAAINFYDTVELLGTREMLIGSATTDGTGSVSLSYLPAQAGTHHLVARAANAQLAALDAATTFDASVVAPSTYARERLPLDRFSVNLPFAGETVLLVVWGLFAFVVIGSLIRIPRGIRRDTSLSRRAREI